MQFIKYCKTPKREDENRISEHRMPRPVISDSVLDFELTAERTNITTLGIRAEYPYTYVYIAAASIAALKIRTQ